MSEDGVVTEDEAIVITGLTQEQFNRIAKSEYFSARSTTSDDITYYLRTEVEYLKKRLEWIRERNAVGDLSIPDDLDI